MDRLLSMAVFVSAIEQGSIAAAGRLFGLSPAMAGRYLLSLEESLPARLVQRTTRRLSLTDAGLTYFNRCKRILEELEEANTEAVESHGSPRGSIRIAAPSTFGATYLAPVIATYMRAFPNVSVLLHLQDRYVDLADEGFDLALRIGQLPDSNLAAKRLATCRLIACAAPAYLKRAGVPQSASDLETHERIGYLGAVTTPPWSFTDRNGVTTLVPPSARFTANDTAVMREMALQGLGVAYAPSFAFARELQTRALVQVLSGYVCPELPLQVVSSSVKSQSQKARHFVEHLAAAFAGAPPWERWTQESSRP